MTVLQKVTAGIASANAKNEMPPTEPISLWVVIKNSGYVGAIFLGVSLNNFTILGAFMLIDTLLGVIRVAVVHGPRAIKSYRLISGLISKMSILLIPLIIAQTGAGIGLDLHSVATSALSILILSHAYSILGNIHSIYLKKDVYEFDAVSWVLTKIQLVIERILKNGAPDKVADIPPTNRDQSHENS